MALSLIDAPSPIQVRDNGIIVVRCEDYLGPARGTLTTAADGNSVAGTVVVDTQEIAVATTTVNAAVATRWALAADTLRIPWADITPLYDTSASGLYLLMGMKHTGAAPSNAQYLASYFHHPSAGGGPVLAYGRGSTFHDAAAHMWTGVWGDQYRIATYTEIFDSQFTGTNLTVRVWGVTGGDSEFSLDVLYMIPFGGLYITANFGGNFPPWAPSINGVNLTDLDEDTTNTLGKFSVTHIGEEYGIEDSFSNPQDFQEANDEVTVYNAHNNIWDGFSATPPLLDPESWMTFEVAPMYLPAATILTETFPDTHANGSFLNAQGYVKSFGVFNASGGFPYAFTEGGGAAVALVPGSIGPGNFARADLSFGGQQQWIDGDAHTPPLAHPLLDYLTDQIHEWTFSADTQQQFDIFGGTNEFGIDVEIGLLVRLDGAGSMDAELVTVYLPGVGATGDGPDPYKRVMAGGALGGSMNITGGWSPGDVYRVVVERRQYYWRAKVWLDGDADPGWMLDGYASFAFRNNAGSVLGWIDYPYDDNWGDGNANHDVAFWDVLSCMGNPLVWVAAGLNQPNDMNVFVQEFSVETDPGTGTIVDVAVQEENYDFTDPSNELTVPYATESTWRLVDADRRFRTFNADTDGFNLRGWKDGAGVEMQAVSLPAMFFKGIVAGFIPQIYRRIYG